ncbi:MAG: AAA family ATPase [Candidatus Dormibacteria bacterium]
MDEHPSPFIFDGTIPPEEVVGRDAELAALRTRAQAGRFTLLYAPRRYGKTSLIGRLQHDSDRSGDMFVIAVDLEGCQNIDDLTRRFAAAYNRLPRTTVGALLRAGATALQTFQPTIPTPLGSFSIAGAPPSAQVLERLLSLPLEAAEKTKSRILVVLDEFQAIASISNADSILRSQIQHQRRHVSYLFSGSERHVLHTIFNDIAKPLYGQAEQLQLGPLPTESAVLMVINKFESTGRDPGTALELLIKSAAGHPQRLAVLGDSLWHNTPPGEAADEGAWNTALAQALGTTQYEFVAMETALTPPQRRVVRLLAWGESATGAAAARLGLGKGSGAKALESLIAKSIASPRTEAAASHLIDPLFAIWIRSRQPRP